MPNSNYTQYLHPRPVTNEPMVKLNVRTIRPPNEDMSKAYSARDFAGLNTSTQKIPDSLVLDKNPITKVPQRPFFVQT
jgi:hypothetical protein